MKLKIPGSSRRLVIHSDGTFSVRVKHGRKWSWLHWCSDIRESDFRRLLDEEKARIRKLERRKGITLVVADYAD